MARLCVDIPDSVTGVDEIMCVVIHSHIHSTGVSVVPSAVAQWGGRGISTLVQGMEGTETEPDIAAKNQVMPVLAEYKSEVKPWPLRNCPSHRS